MDLKAADWAILKNSLKAKDSEFTDVSINDRLQTARARHAQYGWVKIENGQVTLEGYNANQRTGVAAANAINRGYSRQVLKATAAKYGWALRANTDGRSYVATKRY